MDMIEKVARAIEATMFAPHELPLPDDLHQKYLVTARAAIEAMREPTEEMCEAGDSTGESGTADDGTQGETYYEMDDVWKAMIDAALPDPPK